MPNPTNPTCLWCGSRTHAEKGKWYYCMKDGCAAKAVMMPLEMFDCPPVPAKIMVYNIEVSTSEGERMGNIGPFASLEAAKEEAAREFTDGILKLRFTPKILRIYGGIQ